MQNDSSTKDDRPLFARGFIFPSPPASPYQSPIRGPPRQSFSAPNSSPRGQHHSALTSPFSSPRFSTPVFGRHPRQPKYQRESYGSPRSPWQPQGQYQSYPQRHRFSSSPRSSGSQASSWSGSPFHSSPRYRGSGGSSDSYVKPSMVEDPWAELQDMVQVTQDMPCTTATQETDSAPEPACSVSTSDSSGQCMAETGANPSARHQPATDQSQCS
ncbi:uncharacterized protein LOC144125252 [Amblyomma americanum]